MVFTSYLVCEVMGLSLSNVTQYSIQIYFYITKQILQDGTRQDFSLWPEFFTKMYCSSTSPLRTCSRMK